LTKKEDVRQKVVKQISNILQKLESEFNGKTQVIQEMILSTYSISHGGVTQLNLSRWSGEGGSYRSIQRMMATQWNWLLINLLCFGMWSCLCFNKFRSQEELLELSKKYILALDEVVEPKSRKKTYGIGHFFSSILKGPVNAIKTHVGSIVDTTKSKSFVLDHHQIEKQSGKDSKQVKVVKKRKAGRPKGSKNKTKEKELGLIYTSMESLLKRVCPAFLEMFGFALSYVVADGSYGNKTACLIAKEYGLELISKLNCTSALYWSFTGEQKARGRNRIYGDRIDLENISINHRINWERLKNGTIQETYHLKGVRSTNIPYLLNVVIIKQTKKDGKVAIVILFSTCQELTGEEIIKFYRLRFQIEFNFRNAKQYFGLADFKNTKKIQVTNAISWAFFMENVSTLLLDEFRETHQNADLNIQDLKAWFRGQKYLNEILNYAEKTGVPILNEDQKQRILKMGSINWNKGRKKAAA